jgi:thiamine-monophosphate kinase
MAERDQAPGWGARLDNLPVGEFDLLARLRERLSPAEPPLLVGVGDDAAVSVPAGATATSVDAIVEGVHFRRRDASLRLIGRKGLAAALSDLAAMGAESGEAYVILGVPEDLDEGQCLELLDGIQEVGRETGTALAGGDVTRSPVLSLAFTVVGHAADAAQMVTRDGAGPGDALLLTGEIGGAAAGLLLLERPQLAEAVPEELAERLRARLLDPTPRLAEGRALAAAGARAMIDLSDGLGADADHVARQSGALLRIDATTLPLAKGLAEVSAAAGKDPVALASGGGEDYELLACVPREQVAAAARAVAAAGTAATVIGSVERGLGAEIRLADGRALKPDGFDQLR